MLTLTLKGRGAAGGEDTTRIINSLFSKFRTYLKRHLGFAPTYIRVLEYQKNGNAHLHVLLNQFILQDWISDTWAALGGGKVVWIKRRRMRDPSHYLSKYLTKAIMLSAPKRTRRVTTSRDIKLNPKQRSELVWSLLHFPISILYEEYRTSANHVCYDAEGNVIGFEAIIPPLDNVGDLSSDRLQVVPDHANTNRNPEIFR